MHYQRNKQLIYKTLDKEILIFDATNNLIITLNETGKVIWQFLWKKRTLAEITEHLAKEFAVNLKTATADSEKFLKQGVQKGIIQAINA